MKALIVQHLGDNWAVGIETTDPKEIESQDFSWYNHGAYNGELKFMSPRFAYIWTNEEKYKKYLYNSSMAIFLNKYGNKLKSKIRRAARLLAHLRLAAHKKETFIVKMNTPIYGCSLLQPVLTFQLTSQAAAMLHYSHVHGCNVT